MTTRTPYLRSPISKAIISFWVSSHDFWWHRYWFHWLLGDRSRTEEPLMYQVAENGWSEQDIPLRFPRHMCQSPRVCRHRYFNSSPLDKMAAILTDDIFRWIFLNENDRIPIQISPEFVARSPIDYKPALVQVMTWCRTGDKPLPEPMMTQFTDAYMRH